MSGGDIARTAEIEWVRLAEQAAIDQASADHVNLGLLDDGTVVFVDESDVVHVLAEVGTAGLYDAADITYTPTTATDWDSDADPGDLDDALDQLAERVDDLEGTTHAAVTLGADAGAILGLTGQQIDLDTQTANYVLAGPTSGAAADPTFRALVVADLPTTTKTECINIMIDGGVSAITTGVKAGFEIPAAMTISAWRLISVDNTSGAIKIDLWVDSYANFPPTDADSITNGHEPEIAASGVKAEDTDIADWSGEALTAGSWMLVNVDSCASIKLVTLSLTVTRT